MWKQIAILGCALALASCRKHEPPAQKPRKVVTTVIPENVRGKEKLFIRPDVPNILDKAVLGSKLAPDGTVAQENIVFAPRDPIALTIWLKQSPPGLSTGAIWYHGDGKAFAHEQRTMNGAKVVTFSMNEKLKPGKYRVEGYWGGNVVADKTFEVTSGKK